MSVISPRRRALPAVIALVALLALAGVLVIGLAAGSLSPPATARRRARIGDVS
jgi:hypothetical protein